ncbi:response regulator receiver domain-containing protein [Paraburkholderia rhizosphaerae]|uniref:Response regulator receiver domain-containing protein n=1 Tax=Paraburkholderia rhizosphaerae TaxID=480658 RepID=A0A4R8LWC0_9BURK|nr:response regulator receiver domain-containing protein [Paraburkholderia rhizosphaerae]
MSDALVVLDLGLPRAPGDEVLATIRECGCNAPVIVLTAKGTVADKVLGQDLMQSGIEPHCGGGCVRYSCCHIMLFIISCCI